MGTMWYQQLASDGRETSWKSSPVGATGELDYLADLPIRIVKFGTGTDAVVALLVPPAMRKVWINGEEPVGGLRVLAHRDEILVGRRRLYYSAESRPQVSVFSLLAGQRQPRCAVCRNPIDDGQSIVSCPQCGRSYHQISAEGEVAAKQCWTYRPQCICGHPTGLDADATWRPEKEASCV